VASANHLPVLRVDCLQGYCEIAWPFAPEGLREASRDPARASAQLVAIVAVIAAQAFGEGLKFPGKACPWTCHDARLLARFEAAYGALPPRLIDYNHVRHPKLPWDRVMYEARTAVRTWSQRPGVPLALLALAGALGAAQVVEARGWRRLWASDVLTPLRVPALYSDTGAAGQRRYWITHPDSPNGTCKECEAIAAENADGVGEGAGFATGIPGDTIAGPPAHKHCRCTVEVR